MDIEAILKPDWVKRALDPKSPTIDNKSVFTESNQYQGKEILYPTIRLIDGKLIDLGDKAMDYAIKKGDYLEFDSPEEATSASIFISDTIDKMRRTNKPLYDK